MITDKVRVMENVAIKLIKDFLIVRSSSFTLNFLSLKKI